MRNIKCFFDEASEMTNQEEISRRFMCSPRHFRKPVTIFIDPYIQMSQFLAHMCISTWKSMYHSFWYHYVLKKMHFSFFLVQEQWFFHYSVQKLWRKYQILFINGPQVANWGWIEGCMIDSNPTSNYETRLVDKDCLFMFIIFNGH